MGLFDREVESSFDRAFDLNRDGVLDPAERALQLEILTGDLEDEENEDIDDYDDDDLF